MLKLTSSNSPWVILNDLGGAFVMGAIGGGIWHSVKGAKNSPRVSTMREVILFNLDSSLIYIFFAQLL